MSQHPGQVNVARVQRLAAEHGFDAVVAAAPENVFYTCGLLFQIQRLVPERMQLVITPANGPQTLVGVHVEERLGRRDAWIADQRYYVEFQTTPMQALAAALRERGLERGRIGIEADYLPARHADELRPLLPAARIEPGDEIFHRARQIKQPHEIEALRQAAVSTVKAMAMTFMEARPGWSEDDVRNTMRAALARFGALEAFVQIKSGPNTLVPHHAGSGRRPEAGEVVHADCAGDFGPYLSDLARVAVVGGPTPAQRDLYARLWDVQRRTIERLRPGVAVTEVYELCRQALSQAGLDFRMPHIGHALGLSYHEHPVFRPDDRTSLAPGMVMDVEPGVVGPDRQSYHLEDLVLVTGGDPVILSDYDTAPLYAIRS